jgi:hypothetical protein
MKEPEIDEWAKQVPDAIRKDTLWKLAVYRLSLYVADIGWDDVTALANDRRTIAISDQLNRALGGISSTIAEGYSRAVAARIEFASTNMPWAQRARAAIGTSKPATS